MSEPKDLNADLVEIVKQAGRIKFADVFAKIGPGFSDGIIRSRLAALSNPVTGVLIKSCVIGKDVTGKDNRVTFYVMRQDVAAHTLLSQHLPYALSEQQPGTCKSKRWINGNCPSWKFAIESLMSAVSNQGVSQ